MLVGCWCSQQCGVTRGTPQQQGLGLGAGCGHGCWKTISSREQSPAPCRAATRGKWRPTVTMCHRGRVRQERALEAQGLCHLPVRTERWCGRSNLTCPYIHLSVHPSLLTPGLPH